LKIKAREGVEELEMTKVNDSKHERKEEMEMRNKMSRKLKKKKRKVNIRR